MIIVYALFLVPILLFVLAFLYETILSFRRLGNSQADRAGYVHATWEVTHTLLIFGLVVMLMLFSKSIDGLSAAIFVPAFLAAAAFTVRLACYIYIFYVRKDDRIGTVDWLFALSHVVAAVLLVATVAKALWYLYSYNPPANVQFVPPFLIGLVVILGLCALPVAVLYFSKHDQYR